jgi:antitoxin (DNA-binding transcriptional repressor) of toxin-antitoxin stability system
MINMNAIITLKQLRNDPREYIRLLKNGYEVDITEHRKTIVRAVQSPNDKTRTAGSVQNLLGVIESMPPIKLVDKELETVEAIKKAKREHLQNKYQ